MMRGRTTRAMVSGALVLVMGTAGILLARDGAPPASAPAVSGELAFSETLVFDYDRDGVQERVQFWIEFEARPAPGEPGPEVESGSLTYYVFDLESEQRVDDWMIGFNMTMGGGFPRAGESYPLTNVSITGKKARFDLRGTSFTIIDRGDSWEDDSIQVRDLNGLREGRFYGGDVRVVPDPLAVAEPLDIAANRACNECHEEYALTMAVGGGPHRELECAACHVGHPPEVEDPVTVCLDCHEGHETETTDAVCVACHSDHAVATVAYGATLPDARCVVCHDDAAETLRASRSLHMGVNCVLCHQEKHGASVGCGHCHGAPHPQHVMRKPDVCGDCHNTAHALESARAR